MKVNEPENVPAQASVRLGKIDPKAAFERIFSESWSKTLAVLVRLVGDTDEAEDLALETFLKLYDRIGEMDHLEQVGGWLYRVAFRLGLNALRSKKRRVNYEGKALAESLPGQSEQNPAQVLESNERQAQVRQVLAEMNPETVRLLVLRSSGLSYRDLAADLDVPVHSIGQMLSRAEQQFEKRFRARFGEPE
jgi:RNA polymerase sigma-70 factor (ECF subfamily)